MERSELESLTVAELKALAEEQGVELSSGMKKAEIVDAILASGEAETEPVETEEAPEAETESDQKPEAQEKQEEYDDSEKIKLTYLGPTLPDGLLTTGKMLWGTMQSIMDYVEPEVRRYPKVKVMLVRQEDATKARNDIRSGKGIYYKYYVDLVDEVKKGRVKK